MLENTNLSELLDVAIISLKNMLGTGVINMNVERQLKSDIELFLNNKNKNIATSTNPIQAPVETAPVLQTQPDVVWHGTTKEADHPFSPNLPRKNKTK
jgi:hypothetical protein